MPSSRSPVAGSPRSKPTTTGMAADVTAVTGATTAIAPAASAR